VGKDQGLVMVVTGNGKGKTTAAFGQALRAAGHGLHVLIVQFMKGDPEYGEVRAAIRFLPTVEVVQSGLPTFVEPHNPGLEDVRLARRGLELARKAVAEGRHFLVILDEINVAVEYGLLAVEEVLDLLKGRAPGVNVLLTGRYAPAAVCEQADLVSEVREVRHHYHQGVPGREGIEH